MSLSRHLFQEGVKTGNPGRILRMKWDLQLGTMRSLVLRTKMYQEGKGEHIGAKRCFLGTKAHYQNEAFGERMGMSKLGPRESPDASAESPHSGPILYLHIKLVPGGQRMIDRSSLFLVHCQDPSTRHFACLSVA